MSRAPSEKFLDFAEARHALHAASRRHRPPHHRGLRARHGDPGAPHGPRAATLRIEIQNEYLVAFVDDVPLVTAPDLISLLDHETATPDPHRVARLRAAAGGDRHALRARVAPAGMLDLVGPRPSATTSTTCPFGDKADEQTLRLGIDVGGTNTDAVVVDATGTVLATLKAATTPEPLDGIRPVMEGVSRASTSSRSPRRCSAPPTRPTRSSSAGAGPRGHPAPGGAARCSVTPGCRLAARPARHVMGPTTIVHGGYEYDGREIAPLDEEASQALRRAECAGKVKAIAVVVRLLARQPDHEFRAAEILAAELGDSVAVSSRHQVGSLGLLERENATALNAALLRWPHAVVERSRQGARGPRARVAAYLTQNDGTLMSADQAEQVPGPTFASGPTNSMRGACALAGLKDALVIDVGGTSSDVGILVHGFPRESATAVEVGGVRTNFRMPDLISIGLGGGTIVRGEGDEVKVGPDSVGYRVVTEALVMGGAVPTLSDVSVKGGRLSGFGDAGQLGGMSDATAAAALRWVDERIQTLCDRMKAAARPCRSSRSAAARTSSPRSCRVSRRSSCRPTSRWPTRSARPSRRRPARSTASTATRS